MASMASLSEGKHAEALEEKKRQQAEALEACGEDASRIDDAAQRLIEALADPASLSELALEHPVFRAAARRAPT